MSAVAQFPLHAKACNRTNVARALDSYERGYNAAINVVVPEIRRQRGIGMGIGFAAGIACGVVVAVITAGWLA